MFICEIYLYLLDLSPSDTRELYSLSYCLISVIKFASIIVFHLFYFVWLYFSFQQLLFYSPTFFCDFIFSDFASVCSVTWWISILVFERTLQFDLIVLLFQKQAGCASMTPGTSSPIAFWEVWMSTRKRRRDKENCHWCVDKYSLQLYMCEIKLRRVIDCQETDGSIWITFASHSFHACMHTQTCKHTHTYVYMYTYWVLSYLLTKY